MLFEYIGKQKAMLLQISKLAVMKQVSPEGHDSFSHLQLSPLSYETYIFNACQVNNFFFIYYWYVLLTAYQGCYLGPISFLGEKSDIIPTTFMRALRYPVCLEHPQIVGTPLKANFVVLKWALKRWNCF